MHRDPTARDRPSGLRPEAEGERTLTAGNSASAIALRIGLTFLAVAYLSDWAGCMAWALPAGLLAAVALLRQRVAGLRAGLR